MVQTLPRSAEAYHTAQRREIAAALFEVRRLWRRVDPADFDGSWAAVEPTVGAVVLTAQQRVSEPVGAYVSDVLRETGQARADFLFAEPLSAPLVGTDSRGFPVDGILGTAPLAAKSAVARGATPAQAVQQAGRWLNLTTATILSDTARQTEVVQTSVRPVTGYVRMLNPPSCSRCAILAGKWYRKNQGFARHPGCDCRHIPAAEEIAGDLTVSPDAYFESLPAAEQDRIFTKAGAEAIRAGADVSQVVNARAGMSTAQRSLRGQAAQGRLVRRNVYGQQVYTTTAGRGPGKGQARLMPESIVELAQDRDDLIRLLKHHRYIR